MDVKQKVLFIICCFVAILITIFASLVASVNFKREQYNKNPYYWCDATWECCKSENDCDQTKGVKASGLDTYYPSDLFVEGSAYHQNCILPVQNAASNFAGATGATFNMDGLYGFGVVPSTVYGAGCAGPGGTGKCADPTYNPQVLPSCVYNSIDAPANGGINGIQPGQNTLNGANTQSYNIGSSASLSNSNNWTGGFVPLTARSLQNANLTTMPSWDPQTLISATNYACPMTNVAVNKTSTTLPNNGKNVLRPLLYT
jgi:hypothetical protein